MEQTDQKTPLYDAHVRLGGKIVPFAGWLLPVQYSGVIPEHMAVRQTAGLFDVSHMGEVVIEGPGALAAINHLFTNNFTGMANGRVRYSPMCNPQGGVVDDLIVYKMNDTKYFIVVNAANLAKDVAFMKQNLTGDATLTDESPLWAEIALQGPKSPEILAKLCSEADIPQKYYTFTENATVAGAKCLLSRTGYTGELGYELYCKPQDAPALWDALLKAGKDEGLIPCGLGARDTLRLEAGMPLYGHEMDETITPLETGLDFAVKMDKPGFIGKAAMEKKGEPSITRVGLKMTGRGIAREHCPVFVGDEKIGETTSGTHLPYLAAAYAMALIEKPYADVGTTVQVDVRGRRVEAEIVPLPFYKRA